MIRKIHEGEEDYQDWLQNNNLDEYDDLFNDIKALYTKRYDELFNNSENLSNNKDKWILFKVDSNSFKDLFDDLSQINFVSNDFEYTNFKLEKEDSNNPVYSADKTATSDIIGRDGKTVMQENGTVRRAKNLSLSTLRSQLKSKLIKWKKEPELYDYYIKITRDIREISHMSTDKQWDSCQKIDKYDGGGYNHYVYKSICEGLLIAYAYKVKLDDLDSIDNDTKQFAEDAIARISINPFSTADNKFLYLRAIKTYAPTWFHNQQPFNMKSEVQKYLDKHYNHNLLELDDVFYASDSFYSDDRVSEFNPKTQEYTYNQGNNPNENEDDNYVEEEDYNNAYDFIMETGRLPDTDYLSLDNIDINEWGEIILSYGNLIDDIDFDEIEIESIEDVYHLYSNNNDVIDKLKTETIYNYIFENLYHSISQNEIEIFQELAKETDFFELTVTDIDSIRHTIKGNNPQDTDDNLVTLLLDNPEIIGNAPELLSLLFNKISLYNLINEDEDKKDQILDILNYTNSYLSPELLSYYLGLTDKKPNLMQISINKFMDLLSIESDENPDKIDDDMIQAISRSYDIDDSDLLIELQDSKIIKRDNSFLDGGYDKLVELYPDAVSKNLSGDELIKYEIKTNFLFVFKERDKHTPCLFNILQKLLNNCLSFNDSIHDDLLDYTVDFINKNYGWDKIEFKNLHNSDKLIKQYPEIIPLIGMTNLSILTNDSSLLPLIINSKVLDDNEELLKLASNLIKTSSKNIQNIKSLIDKDFISDMLEKHGYENMTIMNILFKNPDLVDIYPDEFYLETESTMGRQIRRGGINISKKYIDVFLAHDRFTEIIATLILDYNKVEVVQYIKDNIDKINQLDDKEYNSSLKLLNKYNGYNVESYDDLLDINIELIANNENIKSLVKQEIERLGNNADLNHLDVSKVTNMNGLFKESSFNGDISKWNVSNVIQMYGMFANSKFNQDISNWNVSNVTDMRYMFKQSSFNQDISNWNVSNVTDMNSMFFRSKFNKDISKWDVSNVTNMFAMFSQSEFNQNIDNWNVSNVSNIYNMEHMFYKSPLQNNPPVWYIE